MAATVHVWLIDDSDEHHRIARATVELFDSMEFTGFMSGIEAVAAYERLARGDDDACPHVVLMDYYLGEERGDRVTRELRRIEARKRRPVIIGYSSVRSGSDSIMAAGGDQIVRKHADAAGVNPTLAKFLREFLKALS